MWINFLILGEIPATQDDRVHLVVFDALMETIPRARPAFRNQLRTEIHIARRKLPASKKPGAFFRQLIVPSLTLILMMALLAATPWGRSFSQQIIRFFSRSESDTVAEATVMSFAELLSYSTMEEAESAVGFTARTPAILPPGYVLDSVQANQVEKTLRITYRGPANQTAFMTPMMTFIQRKMPFDDHIGPSAVIEELTIVGESAEYVEGGWMYVESSDDSQEKVFHWEETLVPLQTLRWMSDGFYFEISFVGSDTQPGYLGKEDLIKTAESLR